MASNQSSLHPAASSLPALHARNLDDELQHERAGLWSIYRQRCSPTRPRHSCLSLSTNDASLTALSYFLTVICTLRRCNARVHLLKPGSSKSLQKFSNSIYPSPTASSSSSAHSCRNKLQTYIRLPVPTTVVTADGHSRPVPPIWNMHPSDKPISQS